MKYLLHAIALVAFASVICAADVFTELNLVDGSRLKGKVMSVTASEVTFMTDFGVSRISLDKLTPESKQSVTQGAEPDVDALLKRVAELEAKVSQLQQENEALRRQLAATPSTLLSATLRR